MSNLISRDSVLAAVDLPTRDVECPEWGATVRVRGLSARERGIMRRYVKVDKATKETSITDEAMAARLVVMCAVDEKGEAVFKDEDIAALQSKSGAVIERIAGVIMDLSGMTEVGQKEVAENLTGAQSGASS